MLSWKFSAERERGQWNVSVCYWGLEVGKPFRVQRCDPQQDETLQFCMGLCLIYCINYDYTVQMPCLLCCMSNLLYQTCLVAIWGYFAWSYIGFSFNSWNSNNESGTLFSRIIWANARTKICYYCGSLYNCRRDIQLGVVISWTID